MSLEWQQWLQNPQFVTLTVNGSQLPSPSGPGAQSFAFMSDDGQEGEASHIPGPRGFTGSDGQSIHGRDGVDGEDGMTIVGPKGDTGPAGQMAILFMEGHPGEDAMMIPGPAGASGSASIPDPLTESFAPAAFSVATGKYAVMADELQVAGTDEITVDGTGVLVICG